MPVPSLSRWPIGIAFAALLPGVLSGCWTVSGTPLPPRECGSDPTQLPDRSRVLEGVTANEALQAAERLLRPTWGEDVKIVRSPHTLSADIRRDRTLHLVLVAYRGIVDEARTIATRSDASGVSVCVRVQGNTSPTPSFWARNP